MLTDFKNALKHGAAVPAGCPNLTDWPNPVGRNHSTVSACFSCLDNFVLLQQCSGVLHSCHLYTYVMYQGVCQAKQGPSPHFLLHRNRVFVSVQHQSTTSCIKTVSGWSAKWKSVASSPLELWYLKSSWNIRYYVYIYIYMHILCIIYHK